MIGGDALCVNTGPFTGPFLEGTDLEPVHTGPIFMECADLGSGHTGSVFLVRTADVIAEITKKCSNCLAQLLEPKWLRY